MRSRRRLGVAVIVGACQTKPETALERVPCPGCLVGAQCFRSLGGGFESFENSWCPVCRDLGTGIEPGRITVPQSHIT